MEDNSVLITNIQRFSLHDGPGIRTTVFTKGCSLACPWCSNPENIINEQEPYIKDGIKGIYGRYWTCKEIYDEVMKDKTFYGTWDVAESALVRLTQMPGGVTFSGGEALLQADKLQPLWELLSKSNIHMAVETSLAVSQSAVKMALKFINLFYVDIKILDTQEYRKIVKGDLDNYFSNLDLLFSADIPVVFRIPVIGGYTDSKENRNAIINIIKSYRPVKVELIKGHNLGNSKYLSLGKEVPEFHEVMDTFLDEYWRMIQVLGIEAEICKIHKN